MRRQSGFTLIELVVVITILGILAAFAIPRFTSVQVQARVSSMQALAGSLRSAAALAHAQWLAEGSSGTAIDVEGATVVLNGAGYPTAAAAGIEAMLQNIDGYSHDGAGVFNAENKPNCSISYALSGPDNTPVVTTTNILPANADTNCG